MSSFEVVVGSVLYPFSAWRFPQKRPMSHTSEDIWTGDTRNQTHSWGPQPHLQLPRHSVWWCTTECWVLLINGGYQCGGASLTVQISLILHVQMIYHTNSAVLQCGWMLECSCTLRACLPLIVLRCLHLNTGVLVIVIKLGKHVMAIRVDGSAAWLHTTTLKATTHVHDNLHEIA